MALSLAMKCLDSGREWRLPGELPPPGGEYAVELLDGAAVLASGDVGGDFVGEQLADFLREAEGARWPDGIGVAYTAGLCGSLAAAMARASDGVIVAIFDAADEEGRDIEGLPWLVHAGCLIDGHVTDVEGTAALDDWEARWSGLATDCTLERVSEEFVAAAQDAPLAGMETASEVAELLLAFRRMDRRPAPGAALAR